MVSHTWTQVSTSAANDGVNCMMWLNDSPSKSNITTPPQICVVGSSIDAAMATWIARNMSANEHLSVFHFSASEFKWTGKCRWLFVLDRTKVKPRGLKCTYCHNGWPKCADHCVGRGLALSVPIPVHTHEWHYLDINPRRGRNAFVSIWRMFLSAEESKRVISI